MAKNSRQAGIGPNYTADIFRYLTARLLPTFSDFYMYYNGSRCRPTMLKLWDRSPIMHHP